MKNKVILAFVLTLLLVNTTFANLEKDFYKNVLIGDEKLSTTKITEKILLEKEKLNRWEIKFNFLENNESYKYEVGSIYTIENWKKVENIISNFSWINIYSPSWESFYSTVRENGKYFIIQDWKKSEWYDYISNLQYIWEKLVYVAEKDDKFFIVENWKKNLMNMIQYFDLN